MPNSNSDRSKESRQKHATARQKRLKNLSSVLLEKQEEHRLDDLRRWMGTPNQPANYSETIRKLINDSWAALPQSAKTLEQGSLQLDTPLKQPIYQTSPSGRQVLLNRYQHPENPELYWSGRGRKPSWVEEWLANDKTLAEIEHFSS